MVDVAPLGYAKAACGSDGRRFILLEKSTCAGNAERLVACLKLLAGKEKGSFVTRFFRVGLFQEW